MKARTISTGKKQFDVPGMALTVALAALIGGLASLPARADDDDRGRSMQQEHSDRARHPVRHSRHHADNRYEAPSYVYAPPPVYYVPPPRQPAIDLVFPLNFR